VLEAIRSSTRAWARLARSLRHHRSRLRVRSTSGTRSDALSQVKLTRLEGGPTATLRADEHTLSKSLIEIANVLSRCVRLP